jgi:hypothetical protein
VHAGQVAVRVGRDAQVRTLSATLGGDLVRLVETAEYAGPGGELEQFGLYFADAGQHLEHRLFVDHNAPHTKSNVDYRGALQGFGAHSVWVGDVLIRKVAEGITTYESNRNLVLTDGCRADSVPNLEIETGQIEGAGHASATGRFDDEQLFYLRSRGIPETEARRLVVHGFFADVIRRVGVPEIEQRLLAAVEAELAVNVGIPLGTGSTRRCGVSFSYACAPGRAHRPTAPSPSRSTGRRWQSSRSGDDYYASRTVQHAGGPAQRGRRRGRPDSSAICTGRASTCAPAGDGAARHREGRPSTPVRVEGADLPGRRHQPPRTELELHSRRH